MNLTFAMLKDWTERVSAGGPLLNQFPDGAPVEDLYETICKSPNRGYFLVCFFAMNLDVAKALVSYGVDVNMKADYGYRPLHLVAQGGDAQTAEYLVAQGAKMDAKSQSGWTPLRVAAYHDNRAVADLLIAHGIEPDLFVAAGLGMEDTLTTMLLSQDPDSEHDAQGQTPLVWAARNGKTEAMLLLLAAGANVNAKDRTKRTPLYEAIMGRRDPDTIITLLAAGATADLSDHVVSLSLHGAAKNGAPNVARVLIARGAPLDSEDENGETPLHIATREPSLDVVGLLIEAGANVNARSKAGRTPLGVAVYEAGDPYRAVRESCHREDGMVDKEEGEWMAQWLDQVIGAEIRETYAQVIALLQQHGGIE